MHIALPATLATLVCASLFAGAGDQPLTQQESDHVVMFNSAGDELSPEMLRAIAKMAAGQEGVTRMSLGNMGEMAFGMSMQAHDEHDDDEAEHDGVMEFDLGDLTDGKMKGHIVIDMNDMMSGHQDDHGEFSSNVDIQMIMEDEHGLREFSRSYHNGNGGQHNMPGDMIMMNAGQLPPGVVMGATGAMPGFAMGMPAPGMSMHRNSDQLEELFHNQFQMMEELEHLRHQVDSFHGDDEEHREDDHHAHMEEMRHHAHELEEHLDRHHDEMDDREREDVRREIEHIHQEIRHMDEEGHENDHDEHHDQGDPFFGMASDFVHKIEMAGHMANALNERESIAVFSVWMARQHLEPEARVDMLSPMMKDESLYLSVRNAATWVVMDALGEMHRQSDAQNALAELIRSNGSNQSSD